ncbi:UNVERIFIED_CONTAM: hypothetical protein PYX00_003441 [Menopon gallinae]|uniref:Uncharacterized protein n=1 Tax=Menopon gallinae TaxID=328185 RepID=A0AAW2HZU6_9NEOP
MIVEESGAEIEEKRVGQARPNSPPEEAQESFADGVEEGVRTDEEERVGLEQPNSPPEVRFGQGKGSFRFPMDRLHLMAEETVRQSAGAADSDSSAAAEDEDGRPPRPLILLGFG